MKALAISMVAGGTLCSVMSVPASAMPVSNLAAVASDLAVGQSVRYRQHRYRLHYGGYGYGGYGYGNYGGYRYGPSSYRYGSGL